MLERLLFIFGVFFKYIQKSLWQNWNLKNLKKKDKKLKTYFLADLQEVPQNLEVWKLC